MNNKITLTVVIILLLLGGGYIASQQMKTKSADTPQTAKKETKDTSMMTSIKDLLSSGKTQMCTYEYSNEKTGTSKGTTYIANGKMRTDYESTYGDGKTYSGSMINDGTYMYMWTATPPQGMKLKITAEMDKQIEEAKQNQAYIDPNTPMSYRCNNWSNDATIFTPPAEVTFTDYSAQMEQMRKMQQKMQSSPGAAVDNAEQMKAAQCAACESLEGEAKAACKSSLQCS